MWTFTNNGKPNRMAKIFKGESPFDDGETLEVIDGCPEGVDIPMDSTCVSSDGDNFQPCSQSTHLPQGWHSSLHHFVQTILQ